MTSVHVRPALTLAGRQRSLDAGAAPSSGCVRHCLFGKNGSIQHFRQQMKSAEDVVLPEYISRPDMVDAFNREISRVDVGVRALEARPGHDGPSVRFRHEAPPCRYRRLSKATAPAGS
jgi:hypothetical protein